MSQEKDGSQKSVEAHGVIRREDLHALEAQLIEQDHNLFRILPRYLKRAQWPLGDTRRDAAVRALLWRLLSPGTVALAGGGIVAVGTLLVLVWQTTLLREQNAFFREQNLKLQEQIDFQDSQARRQRRTELISSLYSTDPRADGMQPNADNRTRSEAVREFVALERERVRNSPVNLEQALLHRADLSFLDLSNVIFVGAHLDNVQFRGSNLQNSDFRAARFTNANFPQADLQRSNFEACNLNGAIFAGANLSSARLLSADVLGVEFLAADLRGADLYGIRNWQYVSSVKLTNIHGLASAPDGFIEWALKNGAVAEPDTQKWTELVRAAGLSRLTRE